VTVTGTIVAVTGTTVAVTGTIVANGLDRCHFWSGGQRALLTESVQLQR
jgi:hypothetical protein